MANDTDYWKQLVTDALNNRTETEMIDFKETLSEDSERIKEHINAFGNNAEGGIFVFGIRKNYTVSSQRIDKDSTVQKVANIAKDTQIPPLRTKVHFLQVNRTALLAIEICSGENSPVFIKDRSPWGGSGCFRRSAASTLPMTEAEIRDRLMRARSFSPDEQRLDEAKLSNLEMGQIQKIIPGFQPDGAESNSNIQILLDNKLIVGTSKDYAPSLAGWLMFANNPQSIRSLRNATIEFQQFKGKTRDEPVKKLEILGTLPQQVSLAIETVKQHIWQIPKIQGIKREDIAAYDDITLREVIINSVVHRDYTQLHQPVKIALFTDRLEVENPGGLLPGLTTLNLIHKRAWRNKAIASLMDKFGLGEMDGQGIDRIYAGMRRLRVPPPLFLDEKHSFRTILSAPKHFDEYSSDEKRLTVLILLILEREIDNKGVRNAFRIDLSRASTVLKSLIEERVIERTTKSMKFARYRLAPDYVKLIWG